MWLKDIFLCMDKVNIVAFSLRRSNSYGVYTIFYGVLFICMLVHTVSTVDGISEFADIL